MTISEHDEEFAGLPVRDYEAGGTIDDPTGVAHRLSIGYDEAESGGTIHALLGRFLDDPASIRATALVIGEWESIADGGSDSASIVGAIAAASPRLPALKAVFLGDVTYEECEISWIHQSDVGPLLAAYPGAGTCLRVRGGEGLLFGCDRHEGLRIAHLRERRPARRAFVRQVASADLPNLEHLELWLGSRGLRGQRDRWKTSPRSSGRRSPAGNSAISASATPRSADQVAVALADAPILGQDRGPRPVARHPRRRRGRRSPGRAGTFPASSG